MACQDGTGRIFRRTETGDFPDDYKRWFHVNVEPFLFFVAFARVVFLFSAHWIFSVQWVGKMDPDYIVQCWQSCFFPPNSDTQALVRRLQTLISESDSPE